MAARLNPSHDERTRAKIKTSQLINRLMAHVNAKEDLLSKSQVTAALGLLRKTLPDLTSAEHKHDGNLNINILRFADNQPAK